MCNCAELNLVGSWCQFYFLVTLNKSWSFTFFVTHPDK